MRIIQTLDFLPDGNGVPAKCGWYSSPHHLMSWVLSCLQLNACGYNPTLYCNAYAAEILIDGLGLPYGEVIISHGDFNVSHKSLWALSKIYTYSLQTEPFLHVDGDVFVFEPFEEGLLASGLIAQNVEVVNRYYLEAFDFYKSVIAFWPTQIKQRDLSIGTMCAINAGVLGGNNIDFYRSFTGAAFEMFNRNSKKLSDIPLHQLNVIIEQCLCHSMAVYEGREFSVVLKGLFEDNRYSGLANIWEVPAKRSYLHFIGHFKQNKLLCSLMAAFIRKKYPEYFYRVINLFKAKKIILNGIFYTSEVQSLQVNDYIALLENSVVKFSNDPQHYNIDSDENVSNDFWESVFCELRMMLVRDCDVEKCIDRKTIESDLEAYCSEVRRAYAYCRNFESEKLLSIDLMSLDWLGLFSEQKNTDPNMTFELLHGIRLVHSCYNWGRMISQISDDSLSQYEVVSLTKGSYTTLVVPELGCKKMSLYDLNPVETETINLILEGKNTNGELNQELKELLPENIVNENTDLSEILVRDSIRQLVFWKALIIKQ